MARLTETVWAITMSRKDEQRSLCGHRLDRSLLHTAIQLIVSVTQKHHDNLCLRQHAQGLDFFSFTL